MVAFLPARAIPTTTLVILVTIVVKFWIIIIDVNEKKVNTPTKDIANSTVKVTFKLSFFCFFFRNYIFNERCLPKLTANVKRLCVGMAQLKN